MLFFADSGERVVVQATMMGGVAILVTSLLLLLWFLDNPYPRRRRLPEARRHGVHAQALTQETSIVGGVEAAVRRGGLAAWLRALKDSGIAHGDAIGILALDSDAKLKQDRWAHEAPARAAAMPTRRV